MMKVFARFSTPEEHDQLVQGIIKEKQIRARLEELKENKKIGFRTIAELN
jgi:transcriptional adapter 2-alpha